MSDFHPKNIPEDMKQRCLKQVEKGMQHCRNCGTDTLDNIQDACLKHKKMYGRYNP